MFKKSLLTILAALFINLTSAGPARAGVAQDADRARKAKETIAKVGTGPAARVEVRLKDKTKLKGHVAEATDDGFNVADDSGKTTRVAYAEVESVKAVKPKSARKKFDEKGLIGVSLIGGIFLMTLFFVSQTK